MESNKQNFENIHPITQQMNDCSNFNSQPLQGSLLQGIERIDSLGGNEKEPTEDPAKEIRTSNQAGFIPHSISDQLPNENSSLPNSEGQDNVPNGQLANTTTTEIENPATKSLVIPGESQRLRRREVTTRRNPSPADFYWRLAYLPVILIGLLCIFYEFRLISHRSDLRTKLVEAVQANDCLNAERLQTLYDADSRKISILLLIRLLTTCFGFYVNIIR